MAFLRLGSKPETFHREGQTWVVASGLPSDIVVEIVDMSFHLHKFPLLSKSLLLEKLIGESSSEKESTSTLKLDEIPGGSNAFELVAKFCYGVKIELNASNVVALRCASEFLKMTEDCGEGNLIAQTEVFLTQVLNSWIDTLKALKTCEELLPWAEEVAIVHRCIESLATKASSDPNVGNLGVIGEENSQSQGHIVVWNGISAHKTQVVGEDWWYEDVSCLKLSFYRQLVLSLEAKGMNPANIAASIIHYTKNYIPSMNRQPVMSESLSTQISPGSTVSTLSESDQKTLLEEIVDLLPKQRRITPTSFLLSLLKTSMLLHASSSCRETLEKKIGSQLDEAVLVDLLIPNTDYPVETLYDIECVQRILDFFLSANNEAALSNSPAIVEANQIMEEADSLSPMSMVASLVDGYLAEVAPDVNLKLQKFEALAAAIPDYARSMDDGLYHAIDVYLKAHPWFTDPEREQICRLMNCQKLSLEASTHAAQNERLPLRTIMRVLFFEQLRLRTSISGWYFVSENMESSENQTSQVELPKSSHPLAGEILGDYVKRRVTEVEKECFYIKQELLKLAKTKSSWKNLVKKMAIRQKFQSCNTRKSCDLKEPRSDRRKSLKPPPPL